MQALLEAAATRNLEAETRVPLPNVEDMPEYELFYDNPFEDKESDEESDEGRRLNAVDFPRNDFFMNLESRGPEAIAQWLNGEAGLKRNPSDPIIEIRNKRFGNDYAACAGTYELYTDSLSGLQVWFSRSQYRYLIYTGEAWKITAGQYAGMLSRDDIWGGYFHLEQTGNRDLDQTLWSEYFIMWVQW